MKLKDCKIGKWYQDNCGNHLYFVVSKRFKKDKIYSIHTAYYLDLKFRGIRVFDDASKLKKLDKKKICFLSPMSKNEQLEMQQTLNAVRKVKCDR